MYAWATLIVNGERKKRKSVSYCTCLSLETTLKFLLLNKNTLFEKDFTPSLYICFRADSSTCTLIYNYEMIYSVESSSFVLLHFLSTCTLVWGHVWLNVFM